MVLYYRGEDNNVPGQTGDHRDPDSLLLEAGSVSEGVRKPDDAVYHGRDQLSSQRDVRDAMSNRSG